MLRSLGSGKEENIGIFCSITCGNCYGRKELWQSGRKFKRKMIPELSL